MLRSKTGLGLAVVIAVIVLIPLAYQLLFHSSRPVEHRTFSISVVGHSMTPSTLVAYSGDTITLIVSADRTEEIHLHGYNFFFDEQPGLKQTQTFPADKDGAFTIEIEGNTLSNGIHLGVLDVYPR